MSSDASAPPPTATDRSSSTTPRPLDGIRVVELGVDVAAPYCGKILSDLGADVVKVEPPDGDPTRREGPFPPDRADDPECSALYLYLNGGKRSVVCDPGVEADRSLLARLLARADVVLDSRPEALKPAAARWSTLRDAPHHPVVTSVTPYGLDGPLADAPADELCVMHAGGLANLLPTRSSSTASPPVKLGGYQAGYQSGVMAAFTTLSLLYRRPSRAVLADVSMQDVMLALVCPYVTLWKHYGVTWCRVPDRPPAMGRLETADGYLILNAFDDHHFETFREIMGNPDWCAGEDWKSMAYRNHHLMDVAPLIDEWARTQHKEELHRRAGEARIPCGPINDAADVLAYRQYEARDYFVDVEHPRAGTYRVPGWPYRLPACPPRIDGPAPLLGEHTEELRAEVADTPCLEPAQTTVPGQDGPETATTLPLAGVRVLEFAWVWAGPYTGLLLGALGADVIKVESHRRQDLMRRSFVWPLPEPRPEAVPTNRGMAFNSVNMNKRGITLDLSTERGAELARRLVADADVVFDNMRPGALDRLGLGPEDLLALRRDLVVASSSGRGRGGPETEYLGYAMPHQGIGGGAYVTGHPDEPPCHSLGDVDILNAMTLASAIVAALLHRRSTGEGQFVDYSQCEGVTSLLGEMLIGYQMTGVVPERMGNRHPRHAPHDVFPAWGVDRWLAISVHGDGEFAALCRVLGRSDLAGDERFATAQARKRNEDELFGQICRWTRERDRDWMVGELRAAGVRAAPSQEARDLWADRHLRERGSFVTVDHPEMGALDLVDAPLRVQGVAHRSTCAPTLGQDTDAVLRDELGLDASEISNLRAEGVIL